MNKIIARDKTHLEQLIKTEINANGNQCDLNHIDVSNVTNMNLLFYRSQFNGNISKWDVSNVERMHGMFHHAQFNGDISNWNVSKVETMKYLFISSMFNADISKWDVSNVKYMEAMFCWSHFNQDLTEWKPYKLESDQHAFEDSKAPVPYWAKFGNLEARKKAIDSYHLQKSLQQDLNSGNTPGKKPKI